VPTIATKVNGILLAQVKTNGYDVVSVDVQGTCLDNEIAELMMTGGKYPDEGEFVYLTWVNSNQLKPGDLVEVTIQDEGDTSHMGKTIAELFPDDAKTVEEVDFTPNAQIFAELRLKPRLREGFRFQLEMNRAIAYVGETAPREHGFGFSVLWNSQSPDRARLSLHSYTIDGLEQQAKLIGEVNRGRS
jgi:hypothetical protein